MKSSRQNPKSEFRNPREARSPKPDTCPRRTRSVLGCGGSPPLFEPERAGRVPESASGLAQSKASRTAGARNLFRFNARSSNAIKCPPYSSAFERRSGLKSALLGAVAVLLLRVVSAQAQPYSIDWFTMDGGGGVSSGGDYTLNGTLGQPDAGTLSVGSYALEGGFWPGIAAPSTTGAPTLFIQLSGNSVIIFWPSPSTGFVLQQTASLGRPAWSNVVQVPDDNGTLKSLTITDSPRENFYRLMKP